MTAPSGAIKFNNVTGSDTAASGLGPVTAVTGSGASITSASNVVTGINTTGVSSGDLLWVQSSSGRQFSIITTVDSGAQVTCDDNFDVTETGRTWAIGGKRATLENSQTLWENGKQIPRSILELETDQATSSYVLSYVGIGHTIRSSVKGTKRVISIGGALFVRGGSWRCEDIHFKSTSGGKLGQADTGVQNSAFVLYDCIVGDSTNPLSTIMGAASRTAYITARRTVFQDFSSTIFSQTETDLKFCFLTGTPTSAAFYGNSTSSYAHRAEYCVFKDFPNFSYQRRSQSTNIQHCIITGVTGYLFSWQDQPPGWVTDNIFYNNSGTAFSNIGGNTWSPDSFRENIYYGTSVPSEEIDGITLTADPFVDAANDDFNLNNAAGGGAVLRSTKYTLGG